MGFSGGQVVKNLPARQETRVWSLDWEDPLEKGMATHFSILARRIPWTEEPVGLQSMGSQRVRHDWATNTQSILKEISPEYSLEGLMLKLQLQYFGHLIWRTDHWKRPWCWERLKAGEGDDRGWDGWMASLTQWTWVWASSGSRLCGQGSLVCCSPWGRKESVMTEWLNWTESHSWGFHSMT